MSDGVVTTGGAEHPNAVLIEELLGALSKGEGARLATFYTDDARYEDPLCGTVKGDRIGRMWIVRTGEHRVGVDVHSHEAGDTKGQARWMQTTVHPETRRKIAVEVRSTFTFRDGRIAEQRDAFSFYRWARQALGMLGWTVGWTKSVRVSMQRGFHGELENLNNWR